MEENSIHVFSSVHMISIGISIGPNRAHRGPIGEILINFIGPYRPNRPILGLIGPFGAHRGLNRVRIDPNRPEMVRIWAHGALWGP